MKIIKEEVLGMRGGWVIKARIVLYHNHQRRAELYLEKVPNVAFQEVGWTVEELAELHNALVKWKEKNKEP
jgi:hypothetical protein